MKERNKDQDMVRAGVLVLWFLLFAQTFLPLPGSDDVFTSHFFAKASQHQQFHCILQPPGHKCPFSRVKTCLS